MPQGSFVLELRLEGVPQARHFCLTCVESVFSCQPESKQQTTKTVTAPMVALDGMAEVLEAAQKLATPSLKPLKVLPMRQNGHASIQDFFQPDFPFNHPSNSAQALALRRRRDAEIDEILIHVDKYERRKMVDTNEAQKSPLIITPPLQMPGEERYKKQGLVSTSGFSNLVLSPKYCYVVCRLSCLI